MTIKQVNLIGGPYDGSQTIASHGAAWHADEFYCHVQGTPEDQLQHAGSYLQAHTPNGDEGRKHERERVEAWMRDSRQRALEGKPPAPMAQLIPITPDRISVLYHMIRSGI